MITEDLITAERSISRTLPIEGFQSAGVGVLDLLLVLVEQKKTILLMTLAGALLAAAYTYSLRDSYTATAVIALPQQQRSSMANLASQLSGAGNAIGGATDLLKNPSELYISLMSSRTVADTLIARFGLQEKYNTRSIAGARKALASRTRFVSGKDFLIRISVESSEPELAAAVANAYIDGLHKMNTQLALTESAQRRRFYEQRLHAQKQALDDSEIELKATQEQTGLLHLNSQMDSAVRTVAQLSAEVTAREVKLETLRAGATEQNPEVVRLRVELDSLRGQLRKAEAGTGVGSGIQRLGRANAPAAELSYLRSLRKFQYNETLFESLSKQFEAASLDEAKEAPLVQVVDPAVPPEQRNPKRRPAIIAFGAACLGLFGACIAVCRHLLWAPANTEKLRAIRHALWLNPRN